MNESPAEDVAVTALQPAASAPRHAESDECSLSTQINSVSTLPSATYCAKYWGISVEGVMGNIANTSGLICLIAVAMASLPESLSLILISLPPSNGLPGRDKPLCRFRIPCSDRNQIHLFFRQLRVSKHRGRKVRTEGTACTFP